MKQLSLIVWAFVLMPFVVLAQQDDRLAPVQTPLEEVEQLIMPPLDNKALIKEELERRGPGIAPRFAEALEVNVTPADNGTWELLDNGQAVWRIRILSNHAKSLNLGFTKYIMPEGGTMVLYSPDLSTVMGPFTPHDNEEHEQLWTPVLSGDELVIEVQLPERQIPNLELQLKYVNHDYMGFGESVLSGSCNLDVICGADDGWGIVDDYRDIIESVAMYALNGTQACTGFLVNNASQDCTPYFMTAFHCGVSPGNASSLVAYWDYQNSFCRQPNTAQSGQNGNGNLNNFNFGSIYRAGYQNSDFILVELDDPINNNPNAFFAGWSAEGINTPTSIAIHHPNTEEKRISFENNPTTLTTYFGNSPTSNYTHVRVADWDVGTTEPGSSGSPLFDSDKRVIGQLHGGQAACSNNAPDWYGSFARSWEGGGTPTTRLKDWLDPDNTGILVLDGRSLELCSFFVGGIPSEETICTPDEAVYTVEVSDAFEGMVTLGTDGLPMGVTATFTDNPIMPGASTTLTISNTMMLTGGSYSFTVTATDGTNSSDNNLLLSVFEDVPAVAVLASPEDAATGVSTDPDMTWTGMQAESYSLQVATDDAFTDVVLSADDIDSPAYTASGLDANSTYFWRVRGENICGEGEWSEAFSFSTGLINCFVGASIDVPIPIADNAPNTITSEFEFPVSGTIADVNVVDLIGTHTWIADLVITLESPSETEVTLVAEACEGEDNFNVNFDDDGNPNLPCPYNNGGTYAPAEPLAAFNGENAQGTWKLTIQDVFGEDGGSLNSWGLDICIVQQATLNTTPSSDEICEEEEAVYSLTVGDEFSGSVDISVDGAPSGAMVDIAPNPANPGDEVTVTITTAEGDDGDYSLVFGATDGNLTAESIGSLVVSPLPTTPLLVGPANNAADIPTENISFTWLNSITVDTYSFELASDSDFNTIVESGSGLTTNTFDLTVTLGNETEYFWRVTGTNACGESVSIEYSFTTEEASSASELIGTPLSIQPNPTPGQLVFSMGAPLDEPLRVDVFSLSGQWLSWIEVPAGNQQAELNLENYVDGIYLLKLQTSKGVAVERIVLQR
jgi:subtilisin-like proprotein convertase family protein/V8-like Glu-specific endopeptidase